MARVLGKNDVLGPTPRRRNLKRSFISSIRPAVHTNPITKTKLFKHVLQIVVLFLRRRPTVHTNPTRKRSFISTVRPTVHTNSSQKRSLSKTLLKPQKFECAGFAFYFKHNSIVTSDCCGFKLLWGGVDGKHLVCFQSKTPFSILCCF